MTYLEGQIEVTKGYIAYWQAVIVSGGYRLRKIYHRLEEGGPEVPLTDDQLLADAQGTLMRHVQRLGELVELIAKEEKYQWMGPR